MPKVGISRVDIVGVQVDNLTMEGAVERMDALVRARRPAYVVTPNADHLVKIRRDEEFRRIYEEAALVLADGMSLVWASYFFGTPIVEKVSGSDLMPAFCARAAEKGYRVFLFGGREGAAEAAKIKLEKDYPDILVVGTDCPPLGFEKDPAQATRIEAMIRKAAPDVLFVGLGAPKQEKWIAKNHRSLGVPLSVGIGVTFEFLGGMVRRAPRWMQDAGIEWLWRLMMEPRRLWKRYLVEDPVFFWFVLKEKFTRKRPPGK